MITRLAAAIALLTFSLACQAAPLPVAVSVLPQKTFVEKIGGAHVEVTVMVPRAASPATYEPRPQQLGRLNETRLYFSIGVPFERAWLRRFRSAGPQMKIVDMAAAIQRQAIAGHEHDHEQEGTLDPHVWTSPPHVRLLAMQIRDELVALDPAHAADYQRNYQRFATEIAELDARLLTMLAEIPQEQRRFMVFHPSWGYFARSYGLTQIPIEAEGKSPGPRALAGLIEHAREQDIRVIFVQPQFSQKSAGLLAEAIGGQVVAIDPLAADWADNLTSVAETLRRSLH